MKKSLLISVIALSFVSNSFAQSTHHPHSASKAITGMTTTGGGSGYGATYYYDPITGNDSLLFSFTGNGNSILLGDPHGNVIQATNGKLYGMGSIGGNLNYGGVFCYNPVNGTDSIVLSFNQTNGSQPFGSLIQASNGLLYGMAQGGGGPNGEVFCYNTVNGKDSVVLGFNGANGANPSASLMQASNGLLYGMTLFGGDSGDGVLFSFNTITGQDSVLVTFDNANGMNPDGALMQASNGLLYGMTSYGGTNNFGTMFSFDPVSGKYKVLINFNDSTGTYPQGSLMQASNGLLYGLTAWGGRNDAGVLFSYNTVTGYDSVLYHFDGTVGGNPSGTLIQASDGLLYGMSYDGGSNYIGSIFSYNITTGKDSLLVSMSGLQNGDKPYGDLFQASDGFLYGMTSGGGSVGAGTFFRFNKTTLQDTILVNCGNSQYLTLNSPMQASNGLIYGMTLGGGTNDEGTLFSYNPATGKDTILVNFNYSNGADPYGSLVQASNGLLYGVTRDGYYYGDLFSYDPVSGKDTVLFTFNGTDGQNPDCTLLQASDGLLYGTTYAGGTSGNGVIFSFNPVTGKDSVLVNFNGTNGVNPFGSLIQAADGLLYGVAYAGGVYGYGMVFSYDISKGQYDTILSVNYDVGDLQGNVIVDTTLHTIYATSNNGGSSAGGALFSYNMKTRAINTLINFDGANGGMPTGLLMWDTAANLIYSTTYWGGTYNYGVLYMYDVNKGTDTILVNFHDSLIMGHGRLHGKKSFAGALGTNPCGILLVDNKSVITTVNKINDKNDGAITVYPNPSNGVFTIQSSVVSGKSLVEVYNVLGEKVYSQSSILNSPVSINLKDSPAGIYFVRAYDEGQKNIATAKIIIE